VAVDGHVDVFLPDARDLGLDEITLLVLDDVHLDRQRSRGLRACPDRLEKPAEELVESGIGERVERLELVHGGLLECLGGRRRGPSVGRPPHAESEAAWRSFKGRSRATHRGGRQMRPTMLKYSPLPARSTLMPDPELSTAQRARLVQALETRRAELRRDVKTALDGSEDDRVVGLRRRLEENDDWGVADGVAEVDIAEVRHALAELTEVDAALERAREGLYGICVDCDEP